MIRKEDLLNIAKACDALKDKVEQELMVDKDTYDCSWDKYMSIFGIEYEDDRQLRLKRTQKWSYTTEDHYGHIYHPEIWAIDYEDAKHIAIHEDGDDADLDTLIRIE